MNPLKRPNCGDSSHMLNCKLAGLSENDACPRSIARAALKSLRRLRFTAQPQGCAASFVFALQHKIFAYGLKIITGELFEVY
jgi:hypothetical protein